ncbi:MAG: hypothetical protein ACO1PN_05955 [Betaproteobacteria bacterium]
MFLKKAKESTDPALRSLVQKAARRGYGATVEIVARRLFEIGDKTWLRSRAVVITFEECWPLAHTLTLERGAESKISALLRVTKAVKQKDAIGLGAMAYAYHEGDHSVLEDLENPTPVRIVSEALSRPPAFFEWALSQNMSIEQERVVKAAKAYLAAATWGWDKTCILAGAYFAATHALPEIRDAPLLTDKVFPYWVALDKHTPQGKAALHKIAGEFGITYRKLIWAAFYFESAKVNALDASPWWEAERSWRLRKAGMTVESAVALWKLIQPALECEIAPEARKLRQVVEIGATGQKEIFEPTA